MKWQEYQYRIYKYLQWFYPNCKLTYNVYLDSLSGGNKRQIDVLVEYELLGFSRYAIVDCKNYSDRIDKKGIEEFSGLVEDVGATHGIMITKTGFTDGAIKRAKTYNMNLEIVNIEALSSDFYYNFQCRGCRPTFFGNEKGIINAIYYFQHQIGGLKYYVFYNMCDLCFSYNFYCPVCDEVTTVEFNPDKEQVFWNECSGNCGVKFYVKNDIIEDNITVGASNEFIY